MLSPEVSNLSRRFHLQCSRSSWGLQARCVGLGVQRNRGKLLLHPPPLPGAASGKQDEEPAAVPGDTLRGDDDRHHPVHQPERAGLPAFWGEHPGQHHAQPAQLLVSPCRGSPLRSPHLGEVGRAKTGQRSLSRRWIQPLAYQVMCEQHQTASLPQTKHVGNLNPKLGALGVGETWWFCPMGCVSLFAAPELELPLQALHPGTSQLMASWGFVRGCCGCEAAPSLRGRILQLLQPACPARPLVWL